MAHVGDLICTGASRFLNPINGVCTDGTSGTTKYMRQDGTWQVPPNSGGTVTSITLKATSPIAIDSTSAITTSGTRTLSHANSGVTAGTYQSVTVNATGHVTAGSALTKAQVTTALGYTPPTSDTNNAVTQTATNTNANYEVLFSATADNTTRTEGARKYSNLLFNPSTGTLTATKFSGDISGGTGLTKSQVTTALGYTPPTSDTNTHRPIQVNGTEILGNNTTALNLKAGSNVSVTNSSGTVTIAATNTNNAVTQTATNSTDANYELLFSATADNTTRTEGARKSSKLYFNPSYNYMAIDCGDDGQITLQGSNGRIDLTGPETALLTINTSTDETKRLTLSHFDIDCYGTTWDGTNTSLKTALSKKLGNTGSQRITNGSIYISTSTITTGVGFFAKNRNNIQCYLYCGDDSMGLYSDNGHGGIIRKFLPSNEVAINGATYSIANPANFRSAIGAAASSSRLTKKNIEDITETEAKKILDIDVKSFDYKDAYILEGYPKRDKYYGVIAEDVLKQIPFVVNVPDDYDESKVDETKGLNQSLLTVDYDKFVPYLIKMVQIQQKEINELKEKYQIPKR